MSTTAGNPPGHGTVADVGWALGVLLRAHRAAIAPELADVPHGPRGYETLLEVVCGRQPSQLALANHLGIDRTVMTYLVDDLAEAGLVERRPDPADRRRRQVVATDRGRAAVAGLCARVGDAEDALLGALDAEDRARFRQMLLRVAGAVADSGAVDPCTGAEADLQARIAGRR